MTFSPFPRFLTRLFSTITTPTDFCWQLLRSNPAPPLPLETTLSNSLPKPPPPSAISSVLSAAADSPSDRRLALRFFVWAGLHPFHRHSPASYSTAAASLRLPSHPHLLQGGARSSVLSAAADSPSDRRLALRFFVWAGLHPFHRHSPASYSTAAASLRLPSHPHLLHSLLDSYNLDSSPVSLKTFKIILNLCHHSNLPFDLALSLFRRIPEFGCRPDVPLYNAILRLSSTPADAALDIFNEMKGSGLRPDVTTYATVIKKLCAGGGRLDVARDLVTRMKDEDGCSPNVVVYSALLDGACECGDLSAALEILEQMEQERDCDCAPNVVSYTCLMKCMCDTGRLEAALGVLDRMGQNGCRPNRVTVMTLLNGFCKHGRFNDAYMIVKRMVTENGGVSSDECYSLLVVCLLRAGDIEVAEGLLGRMVERGVRPDGVACNSLMREICEQRRFFDGYNWVRVLEEKGMDCVDSDVYSKLLAGLCEEGHLVEALKVGRMIVEKGVRVEDSCVDFLDKLGEGDLVSQVKGIRDRDKHQLNIGKCV